MDYIDKIYKSVRLKESKKLLEFFLIELLINKTLSTKILSSNLNLPIPVVTAIKKEFIKLGLISGDAGIMLTQSGRDYVENSMGYAGLNIDLFKSLLYDESYKISYINRLAKDMEEVFKNRPSVNVTLDQAFGTPETAIKRALLGLENGVLIGKNVLCAGDDDLISVAIGFLLRDLFAKTRNFETSKTKIVVFDIDDRFIIYINKISEQYTLPIKCETVNLKDPLPIKYLNFFDCFYTDPPYTINGMILFLSRGISVLKQEKGRDIFLSFGNKPIQENYRMQKEILNHGLVIKKIMVSFNEYHGGTLLGNHSNMIVLETTDSQNALVSNNKYNNPIYTREINPIIRAYQCKNCKHKIMMSTDKNYKFKTIEELKASGCPKCGHQKFNLIKLKNLKGK